MFQIIETQPLLCPSTDAQVGATSRRVPGLLFHTEAWARRKAGLMDEAERREGGDGAFYAVRAGHTWSRLPPAPLASAEWDDIPF